MCLSCLDKSGMLRSLPAYRDRVGFKVYTCLNYSTIQRQEDYILAPSIYIHKPLFSSKRNRSTSPIHHRIKLQRWMVSLKIAATECIGFPEEPEQWYTPHFHLYLDADDAFKRAAIPSVVVKTQFAWPTKLGYIADIAKEKYIPIVVARAIKPLEVIKKR